MKRLLTIALAAGLAASALAGPAADTLPQGAPAMAVPPDEFAGPSNAALAYYRAWMVTDNPAWETVVRQDDAAPLPALQPTIDRFIAAAAIGYCDWGIEYAEGPFTLLPHLGKLRDSARLLKADAARLAAEGDIDSALERVGAMFRMSHQTRRDRTIISSLVGAAISNLACDATDQIVGANPIAPAQARRLLAAAELPDDPFAARAAIRAEGLVFISWAKANLTGRDAGAQLASIVAMEELADDHPVYQLTGEKLAADLDRMAPFYEEAVALFEETDPIPRLQALERRLAEGEFGVAAQLLAASIHKFREGIDRALERRQDTIAKLQMAANR